jgi:hypothetical protein
MLEVKEIEVFERMVKENCQIVEAERRPRQVCEMAGSQGN